MSRIAFLFRTDVHVADKNPASWKGDYPSEILESLRQIGEIAREYEVAAVLDGGDFFHVKAASRNSHAMLIRVMGIHAAYPCPVYCIEGNHDVVGNNLDTVEKQPLGVLYASGVFRHLRDESFKGDGLSVRVVGFPYNPSRDMREIQEIRKRDNEDHIVAIIHALAGENPPAHVEEFFGEPVFRYRDFVYEGGPTVFAFGHWHRDQGVIQLEGRHFVNHGAVSRGSLVRDNVERIPKVSVIEITDKGVDIKVIPLKVASASDVFDYERKERQEKESLVITQFVSQLQESVDTGRTQDVEENVRAMSFAPEVRDRALSYLERARNS